MVLITALYAASLTLLFLYLSFNVFSKRMKAKVGIGFGKNNDELERAARVHGNFIEYVPLILFLFVMMVLNGTSDYIIHILGTTLLIARVLHAWGLSMSSEPTKQRFIGTILTWLILLVCAVLLLLNFFGFIF